MEERTSLLTLANRSRNLTILRMKDSLKVAPQFPLLCYNDQKHTDYVHTLVWNRWEESSVYAGDQNSNIAKFMHEVSRIVPVLLFTPCVWKQNRQISVFPLTYHGDQSISFAFSSQYNLDWFTDFLNKRSILE